MKELKGFLKNTFVGGVIVVLPIIILYLIVKWGLGVISSNIEPMTDWLLSMWALPRIDIAVFKANPEVLGNITSPVGLDLRGGRAYQG